MPRKSKKSIYIEDEILAAKEIIAEEKEKDEPNKVAISTAKSWIRKMKAWDKE